MKTPKSYQGFFVLVLTCLYLSPVYTQRTSLPSNNKITSSEGQVQLSLPEAGDTIDQHRTILFRWGEESGIKSPGTKYRLILTELPLIHSEDPIHGRIRGSAQVLEIETFYWQYTAHQLVLKPGRSYKWKVLRLWNGNPEAAPFPLPSSEERTFTIARKPKNFNGSQCHNGGFEAADFSGWEGRHATFTNSNGPSNSDWQQGFPNDRFRLVFAGGFDQRVGDAILPVVPPNGGARALRLGRHQGAREMEEITYGFQVDNSNQDFRFQFALVLFDPGNSHANNEKPFFRYRIKAKKSNGLFFQEVEDVEVTADWGNPYFKQVQDSPGLIYKEWNCMAIDLSEYVGGQAFIEFRTRDCTEGAAHHTAVAYIDGLCLDEADVRPRPEFISPTEFCLSDDQYWVDGSPSTGEVDHFWSVEESDANGIRKPETERMQWFVASQAGPFDLKAFYEQRGGQWKCNTYYRVKLALANGCVGWAEHTKLILFKCPPIQPIPDIPFCCSADQNATAVVSQPYNPNYQYSWISNEQGVISTQSSTSITPASDGLEDYIISVTDEYGCSVEESFRTYTIPKLEVDLHQTACKPCDYTMLYTDVMASSNDCQHTPASLVSLATVGEGLNYSWSTGQISANAAVNPVGNTNYFVTVTNSCFSQTAAINVTKKASTFTGPLPAVLAPTAFTPNGDGVNDIFEIYHYSTTAPAKGQRPAYNATQYELSIVNRWGNILTITGETDCNGFYNGEINWDGKWNGQLAPEGVYTWKLKLMNCGNPSLTAVDIYNTNYECVDCRFGLGSSCGSFRVCYEYEAVETKVNYGSITLLR